MAVIVEFTLTFDGQEADEHYIDFYDVSQALIGFQRSIALTTHLVLNGTLITQAPALKGAQILCRPAEDGSWATKAAVVIGGVWAIGTASQNTPLGHIVYSAYDYVISESLGVHVDYEKSLGKLYEESQNQVPEVHQYQLDSVIEKCSAAISNIHRPIVTTGTASSARISSNIGAGSPQVGTDFDEETFIYVHEEFTEESAVIINGRVSSYNHNTYKGRIYISSEGRPVPFELPTGCRSRRAVQAVVNSLRASAIGDYDNPESEITCIVFRNVSRNGRLKGYTVVEIQN